MIEELFDKLKNFIFESNNLGVYVGYKDAIVFGLINLMFLLLLSLFNENLCDFFKKRKSLAFAYLLFLITFVLNFFAIKLDFITKQFPYFMSYLELFRYGEIVIIVAIGVVFAYFLIYYLVLILTVRMLLSLLLALAILAIINIFVPIGDARTADNVTVAAALVLLLLFSRDIWEHILDYLKDLWENIKCLPKIFNIMDWFND